MIQKFGKKYQPNLENTIIKKWELNKCFLFSWKKSVYSESKFWWMLPISLLEKFHMGQLYSLYLQDVLVRSHRLFWRFVYWVPAFHHSSFLLHILAKDTMSSSEEDFSKSQKKKYYQWSKTKILEYKDSFVKQMNLLGLSCDWNNTYFSLSEDYTNFVRETFSSLFYNDLIIQETQVTYRNKEYQTVVWEMDIDFEIEDSKKYRVRYFIDTKKDSVVVVTERPDTIFADVALAVNPLDKRYRKFVGKKIIIPIINVAIPLIADERVDMTQDDGVVRITPGHDAFWLEIGKDHGLDLTKFAIDTSWNFTELAWVFHGKPVVDFFDNIVQYLWDISNLDGEFSIKRSLPYCKKTGILLEPMAIEQWFVRAPSYVLDKFSDMLAFDEFSFYPSDVRDEFEDLLKEQSYRCVSRHYDGGQKLPVWYLENGEMVVVDNEKLLTLFAQKWKKSESILLSLIVYNLILDSRLSNNFMIDDLVDVLFSESIKNKKMSTLEVYIEVLWWGLENVQVSKDIKELQGLVKLFDNIKKHDLLIEKLVLLLESSFLISNDVKYYFWDWADCFGSKVVRQEELSFGTNFVYVLFAMFFSQQVGVETGLEDLRLLHAGADHKVLLIRILLMQMSLKLPMWDKMFLHGLILDKFQKKISPLLNNIAPMDLIEEYGSDALRLTLVLGGTDVTENHLFDPKEILIYHRFVNGFWNACRYISRLVPEWDNINLELLGQKIEKNKENLWIFDNWILHVINGFEVEISDDFDGYAFCVLGKRLIDLTRREFGSWFVEISKDFSSDYTIDVLWFVMLRLLKLLHPYMPLVTEQLRERTGIDSVLATERYIPLFELPSKNYKIHLFMDIVSKLIVLKEHLWCKKHEGVHVLIQATPDFLDHVKAFENVVVKLLNVKEVLYVNAHEQMPDGFVVDFVIDINVWIKKFKEESKKEVLMWIKDQLEEKKQYLQYLRTLISSARANWQMELIDSKEWEMKVLKHEIEALEYEFSKGQLS